jgi:hypothetical protein
MEKKFTFVNGDECRENLNDIELAAIITDIVMSNLHCSFQWDQDQTVLVTEG